jgi:putative FmdB family regulatory protein
MPTYEYICRDCGYEFEEFQSITADPIAVCPKCKGKVERKISGGGGLIFKGSGFYITDYKKKPVPPAEKNPLKQKPAQKSKNKSQKKAS